MKKKSLVERILVILKGGDEAKLVRFESKLGKYLDKQIAMRRESIDTLKDKIVDANEAVDEAVISVNPASIASTDHAESYAALYVTGISKKLEVVEVLEEQIKTHEEEIARLEKIRARIYSVEEPA